MLGPGRDSDLDLDGVKDLRSPFEEVLLCGAGGFHDGDEVDEHLLDVHNDPTARRETAASRH